MTKTWILVADSARARLFETDTPHNELTERESFTSSDGRLQERELGTDKPGRSFDSKGAGRHSMGNAHQIKDHEAVGFAQYLAERLEEGCHEHDMEQLILIAAPRFLGQLRAKLSAPVAHRVVREFAKDLTQHSVADIRELLNQRE